jgi:hypothetical protein
MEKRTREDGWDCVPKLSQAMSLIDHVNDEFGYEIKSCVRETELDYMVSEMIEKLEAAVKLLKKIDTEVEYINIGN